MIPPTVEIYVCFWLILNYNSIVSPVEKYTCPLKVTVEIYVFKFEKYLVIIGLSTFH